MRFDNLVQIIVPLIFLALWALTSLFTREAQPLPPRTSGRGPRPDPAPDRPRPAPGMTPSPITPIERQTERQLRVSALDPPPSDRELQPRPPRRDEGIVVIESEPRRAPAPRPETPSRRPSRSGKAATGGTTKRAEKAIKRSLTAEQSASHEPRIEGSQQSKPLASNTAPLVLAEPGKAAERPPSILAGLRQATSSPERLREAFIVAEVLSRPPLALRRPRSAGRARPLS